MTRASDLARLLGAGATINDGTTITTADNTAQLELVSTDADSGIGPHQVFYRNSASPADDDLLCELDFRGRNDNSQDVNYATVNVKANDVSDGTEDGEYILQVMTAGSVDTTMHIKPAEIVFNEDSIDRDFRVESDNDANAFFVEGDTGNVAIGTNDPTVQDAGMRMLHIHNSATDGTGRSSLKLTNGDSSLAASRGAIITLDDAAQLTIGAFESSGKIVFTTGGTTTRATIDSTGSLLINDTGYHLDSGRVRIYNNTSQDALKTYQATSGTTCLWNRIDHTASFFAVFRKSTTTVGTINTDGSSTSYNTSSDYRLKESVSYDFDATTRLKQLKPCRFNWIADETNTLVDGFLAHEVSSIVPEAITGEKDAMTEEILYVDGDEIPEGKKVGDVKIPSQIDPQGIDQSKLIPLLVKTIQELEARISSQETNINDLQKRVTALEGS